MSFAEQLRKARSLKYVTATDFVQSINKEYQEAGQKDFLSYSTYAAYENGKREPRLDQLAELARRLNVSLDTLLEVHPQEGPDEDDVRAGQDPGLTDLRANRNSPFAFRRTGCGVSGGQGSIAPDRGGPNDLSEAAGEERQHAGGEVL